MARSEAAPSLTLIPADEARRILAETPPVAKERVALADAVGRVLAEPFAAPADLPGERRAVMDGYAVRGADVAGASALSPVVLAVTGNVPMGDVFPRAVGVGEAVAIATGGWLPPGADTVVMVEHTAPMDGGARVEISRAVARGANVVERGEDLTRGAAVLPGGRRLRPQDLAMLATFGVTTVDVRRRPRVAVLSTGNELCDPAETPRPGQVRDANQTALGAQVQGTGCEVTRAGMVPDDATALRRAIARLLGDHDAILLSGGSSIGVKDVAADALADLEPPGILCHGIDIRPGKPTLFARAGRKPVVGMPGFPTSSLIVFDAFMRAMLWRLGGEGARDPWPARRAARIGREHRSVVGREDYLRVRIVEREGGVWAEPLPGGSATLSNVVFAHGLVRVDAAAPGLAAGEPVDVLLY